MHFEMRFYNVAQGRAEDMRARMVRDLTRIFKRNDVPMAGAWFVEAGEGLPRIAYIMAHESPESAAACWAGFYGDLDWHETRSRTNAGSELVERVEIAIGLPFAEIGPGEDVLSDAPADELVRLSLVPGTMPQAVALVSEHLIPALAKAGGQLLGHFNVTSGFEMPSLALIVRYPDAAARRAGGALLDTAAQLRGGPVARLARLPLAPIEHCRARPGLPPLLCEC